MDEIREYEDQLVAVQQALKEEPSDELREVEGELQSLLAELRKGLAELRKGMAEGEGTEDGAENGTNGADGVTRGEIKADGVVADADSETKAADGVIGDGEAKVIPKTDSGINTPEKPLKDGTGTPTDPPVAPTPNTSAQPDDYEVGRAKWKSFSGRIAKRKKYK